MTLNVRAGTLVAGLAAGLSLAFGDLARGADTVPAAIEEIVVTSQRRGQPLLQHTGNIQRLDRQLLESVGHQHGHELLTRVAGVWIGRGSGQEHLTAIRSPVLTGAGSCGAFLFLEDGIPSRPTGFCNVNQLFEINSEQAASVEVIRGPGNALYGSNALHGIVNVLMPEPSQAVPGRLSLELGANDYRRVSITAPLAAESPYLASLVYADDGGFRDESGYRQLKGHFKTGSDLLGGDFIAALSFSDLRQETAGFILGQDAYKDPAVNRSNPNPEAFRDASSQRLYALWTRRVGNVDIDIRPFVRHSDMTFLQHFLPGQPLEENGHVSAGVITSFAFGSADRSVIVGADFEWSDVFLKETQFGPTEGSAFLIETRPMGKHYDFDVSSRGFAPFVQADFKVGPRLSLSAGLRAEYIDYEYRNRMLSGNTRDDGSVCGFGGCLYTRPNDRSDDFTNLAPKLGMSVALSESAMLYVNLSRGFRAPQMTELYRLQSGQQVADLDSERLDNVEGGVRVVHPNWSLDAALFAMRKRDSVIRDAAGFSISGARSKHEGLEIAVERQVADAWRFSANASYARHQYDFDLVAARGETFVSGRDVDTAPRWLGSAELSYAPSDRGDVTLQLVATGDYYLDAENQFSYPGHTIANFRAQIELRPALRAVFRLNNVGDKAIADRADFAFGNYRYFPGRGRELFVELVYTPYAGRSESL